MTPNSEPLVTPEYRDELTAKGLDIYNSVLRMQLEPAHNNEYVVIHVDTQDYAIGHTMLAAKRELRNRHPCDGRLVGLKIGQEPEFGLAARVPAAEQSAAHK